MPRKTPLAWHQLLKEKARLLVAIAGIGFADMLMFVQMGFEEALYNTSTVPHQLLQADLVLTNPQLKTLFAVQSFSRERLYQTLANDGVQSVSSIYVGMGQWKNPETQMNRAILVWGVEPDAPSFNLPELQQHSSRLKLLDRVFFDRGGRPEYGAIADQFQKQGSVTTELNRNRIQVDGLFTMGASFVADGNVIASSSTFLKLYNDRRPNQIDIGLVHLKPGSDAQKIQAQLRASLPKDVAVLTPEEFAATERYYWQSQGLIGFIFGIGVIVGFIVGTVIVYQILYTDVANHLPEYATLKAMGYSDRYLLTVLLQEALILAILGFIPGFAVAVGLYQLTYAATLLPVSMTVSRAATVFTMTVVMCSISGAIAMRKLQAADPADIF